MDYIILHTATYVEKTDDKVASTTKWKGREVEGKGREVEGEVH